MGVNIVRSVEITRPSTTPLRSTVLDHATVRDNSKFGLRNNGGLWPSYNTLDTLTPTAICPDPLDGDVFKSFGTGAWVPGFEVAVYGGVQCNAVGLDQTDMTSELRRVFELNEGKGVEQAILANRFVASQPGSDVTWAAPVDLTVGANMPIPVALAMLEGYAASVYSGQATLHLPRAAASLLGDRIVWEGDKAYTRLGSKVAIGGGYDATPLAASWKMFASGEVYVEKSDRVDAVSYVIPGDGSGAGSDENGLAHNTVVGLVERMFRIGVDGFVASITAVPVA